MLPSFSCSAQLALVRLWRVYIPVKHWISPQSRKTSSNEAAASRRMLRPTAFDALPLIVIFIQAGPPIQRPQ